MKYLSVRSPVWANVAETAIDCVVDVEGMGELPFTASASDSMPYSGAIFAECLAGLHGKIAPFIAMTLETAKALAWDRIKKARLVAEASNFFCGGVEYQTDKERITGASQLAFMAKVAGTPFSITWTSADNTHIAMNADQMMAVGVALGKHVADAYEIGRVLREDIDSALTIADVDAIVWPV